MADDVPNRDNQPSPRPDAALRRFGSADGEVEGGGAAGRQSEDPQTSPHPDGRQHLHDVQNGDAPAMRRRAGGRVCAPASAPPSEPLADLIHGLATRDHKWGPLPKDGCMLG